MRERPLPGSATLAAVRGAAVPALADTTTASPPLPITGPPSSCICGDRTPGPGKTFGYAVIKQNANGTVSAQLVVQGAFPNTTYQVLLNQAFRGCFVQVGTLQTNGQGNGNAHVSEPIAPRTQGADVLLRASNPNAFALAAGPYFFPSN